MSDDTRLRALFASDVALSAGVSACLGVPAERALQLVQRHVLGRRIALNRYCSSHLELWARSLRVFRQLGLSTKPTSLLQGCVSYGFERPDKRSSEQPQQQQQHRIPFKRKKMFLDHVDAVHVLLRAAFCALDTDDAAAAEDCWWRSVLPMVAHKESAPSLLLELVAAATKQACDFFDGSAYASFKPSRAAAAATASAPGDRRAETACLVAASLCSFVRQTLDAETALDLFCMYTRLPAQQQQEMDTDTAQAYVRLMVEHSDEAVALKQLAGEFCRRFTPNVVKLSQQLKGAAHEQKPSPWQRKIDELVGRYADARLLSSRRSNNARPRWTRMYPCRCARLHLDDVTRELREDGLLGSCELLCAWGGGDVQLDAFRFEVSRTPDLLWTLRWLVQTQQDVERQASLCVLPSPLAPVHTAAGDAEAASTADPLPALVARTVEQTRALDTSDYSVVRGRRHVFLLLRSTRTRSVLASLACEFRSSPSRCPSPFRVLPTCAPVVRDYLRGTDWELYQAMLCLLRRVANVSRREAVEALLPVGSRGFSLHYRMLHELLAELYPAPGDVTRALAEVWHALDLRKQYVWRDAGGPAKA